MLQNGSENGSEGYSEAPEADSRHSRPGNFRPDPSPDLDQVSLGSVFLFSELRELILSDMGGSKKASETSFWDS